MRPDFGGLAASDAQQFVVTRREDAVRVSAGCPDNVVVRECDVDDGAQEYGVADRATPLVASTTHVVARDALGVRCGGSILNVKDTVSTKHWDSARDLVGSDPPTSDDLPTTLAGEPLDSADKVREFLANLDRARTA